MQKNLFKLGELEFLTIETARWGVARLLSDNTRTPNVIFNNLSCSIIIPKDLRNDFKGMKKDCSYIALSIKFNFCFSFSFNSVGPEDPTIHPYVAGKIIFLVNQAGDYSYLTVFGFDLLIEEFPSSSRGFLRARYCPSDSFSKSTDILKSIYKDKKSAEKIFENFIQCLYPRVPWVQTSKEFIMI